MKKASPAVTAATRNQYYGVGGFTSVIAFFANYANFTGRSTRSEYWWFTLFASIFSMIATIGSSIFVITQVLGKLDQLTTGVSGWQMLLSFGGVLWLVIIWGVVGVGVLLPSVALVVRRFRDAGVHWSVYAVLWVINLAWALTHVHDDVNLTYWVSVPIAVIMVIIEVLPAKNPPQEA